MRTWLAVGLCLIGTHAGAGGHGALGGWGDSVIAFALP